MENVEKIICCDKGNNDLLTGMLAGGHRNDENPLAVAAMMNGGMGNQWNNPFIYLVWMMFAQRMWGNDWNNHYNDPNKTEGEIFCEWFDSMKRKNKKICWKNFM